jgi:putative heme-binding domain-containing protein
MAERIVQAHPKVVDDVFTPVQILAGNAADSRVRLQALLSLGTLAHEGEPEHVDAVEDGLIRAGFNALSDASHSASKAIRDAVLTFGVDQTGWILDWRTDMVEKEAEWLYLLPLIEVAGSRKTTENRELLCKALAEAPAKVKPSVIAAFSRGLKRVGSKIEEVDTHGVFQAAFIEAARHSKDIHTAESARLDAIELLGVSSSKEAQAALIACLGEKQHEAIQSAAIRVLAPNGSEAVATALIGSWAHYGPKAQSVALEALLARDERAVALLEAKVVKPEAFSAAQVQALIKHKSPKVAAAAKTALASVIPPSREEMAAKFKPAVIAKGDATKGMNHYISRCMACHRAGTMGLQVGPDLITVKTKGREALLEAILMPHKEVASQFIAYTVNTKDGQTLSGIITNDTASSMTIKMMGGLEKTLQRSEIKGSSSSGQSLMPEGLETGMTVEDMADLLSFIEGL